MNVKIGFCTSKWWVSGVIRFFTRAPVSHAYICFDAMKDADHEIYEAAWDGFRMSTRAKLTCGSTVIVKEITVDVDAVKALGLCRARLETPYSYAGLFGEAWVQIGRWCGRRWRNPDRNVHHEFCSQIATNLLQQCGCVLVAALDAVSTSPYDLDLALTPKPGERGAVGLPLKLAEKVTA